MTCCCGSIGASGMRMCEDHHRYWLGDKELASVSSVIRSVYPKKSWDGVDRAVIERARERGSRVDAYLSKYVTTGNVMTEPGEWVEVLERLDRVVAWWNRNVNGVPVSTQKILYSERDGIAGTADFVIGDMVMDLKNTAQIEKSYAIQVGAYAEYENASRAGVLHVTAKSCAFVPYNAEDIRSLWNQARQWWQCIRKLETA